MLKKRERLTRSEFETLLQKGRRVHSAHMSLVYRNAQQGKCGVVVSKKTANKAVERHTLRRRSFSIFATHSTWRTGVQCAVLVRPNASALSYSALHTELTELLNKI